ncbi:Polysaccharide export protein [Nitrobacter sp. Nb-311A]|uniref:polysaccharide biosynthesis/export family protein n=1 Tax=unclassified Nitrobacter TaxID=2620411 RepID=UPI0000685F93|nr:MULTISPECIES: polysaccharide biosynthesis/export family protein [unclassified Nitrobacter]EAQ34799.1 Polysaccharide export protein [Nitrobacter sp. Nb-311A]MCB1394043.1 polysaccharide export protein [Nitrobacter sp.]MCV0387644.1 polysaccharide export protein [Nitrobacter sp.]
MRNVRAVTLCLLSALALSGCMRQPAPVAMVRPHNDLDALAYGGRMALAPPPVPRRGLWHTPAFASAATPVVYAAAPPPLLVHDAAYRLGAGDRLRIVVYGQEGLTNTYLVDAGGNITMPLIGAVTARGRTPAELSAAIAARLRKGYIRQPYVAAEVEAYRPFFILGEVAAPGQYPFVPNMTVESAVAIAGGFSPRARRDLVTITHTDARGTVRLIVPTATQLSPGDTVLVDERWF